MTRVLASPTLARWLASRSASMNLRPAARPPLMPQLMMAPAPRGSSRLASSKSGCDGSDGWTHPIHGLALGQEIEHRRGVLHVALHAQRQGLDALQQVEGIGRRQAGAEIAQALGARPHDEGGRAELLAEDDAVIAGIGLGDGGKLAGGRKVETAAVDDDAADGDAVAADPLGDGMHHDVGAELDRPAEIGRCEGVVDQQRNAGGMGDVGDLRDVEHLETGIADGLGDDQPGLGPDGGAEAVEIARLDERRRDAEARQCVGQQIDGAAVERRGGDDVVARAHERGDGEVHRGHAARRADRADAGFERRNPFLQNGGRRIGDAGVDVAGALQIEQRGRMVGILKDVGRRLVDRNGARAGHRIRMLPGVQAERFKRRGLRSGHAGLQNSPTIRPSAPTSIESAAGTRGRPGMVMISPQIATTNSAPAESRTSRTLMM